MQHWKHQWEHHLNYGLKDSEETFLTFDQWFTLFKADPKNWDVEIKSKLIVSSIYSAYRIEYCLPYYTILDTSGIYNKIKERRFIKFSKKKDYKKFVKFWKQRKKLGYDYENDEEILSLTKAVHTENQKELERQHKENQKTIEALKETVAAIQPLNNIKSNIQSL